MKINVYVLVERAFADINVLMCRRQIRKGAVIIKPLVNWLIRFVLGKYCSRSFCKFMDLACSSVHKQNPTNHIFQIQTKHAGSVTVHGKYHETTRNNKNQVMW